MAFPRTCARTVLLLAFALAGSGAFAQTDPPTRVGSVSAIVGSVVLAPAGATEWADAPLNRPVTAGDRLWTDTGSRADVQLGTAVLHVDSETFVAVRRLDDVLLQAALREGTLQARVRALAPGELLQVDTPQLAFRAVQPGTYRIDADPRRGVTRVTVRSGLATVSGRSGRTLTLYPGQQLQVAGSDLERVASVSFADDDFDAWAGARDAREDRSAAARYVPALVGAPQLDGAGTWTRDPVYGIVWYPDGVAADWAPYRYGRWQWIRPWGWTWIDDAAWGFAPFHYGRWTTIDGRWAWVPGRVGPGAVYAPALVAFVGAGSLPLGSGETIGWYPLAPGEPWHPFFPVSAGLLRRANEPQGRGPMRAEHRIEEVTAVRIEQFRSGEPVQRHWQRARPVDLSHAQPLAPPAAGTRHLSAAGRASSSAGGTRAEAIRAGATAGGTRRSGRPLRADTQQKGPRHSRGPGRSATTARAVTPGDLS